MGSTLMALWSYGAYGVIWGHIGSYHMGHMWSNGVNTNGSLVADKWGQH